MNITVDVERLWAHSSRRQATMKLWNGCTEKQNQLAKFYFVVYQILYIKREMLWDIACKTLTFINNIYIHTRLNFMITLVDNEIFDLPCSSF